MSITAQGHQTSASPDRIISTPMINVSATPNTREVLSKTSMNFAPVYEKAKSNVFN